MAKKQQKKATPGKPTNISKKPKTYKGKSTAPGGGGSFQMMVDAMKKKGMSEHMAEAVAANAGRRKYGKKRFQKMAARGRKRAKK